jgi:hypothetical protein
MAIDDEKSIEELRREIVTIRLDRDAWIKQWTAEKDISDELYFFIKDNIQDIAKFDSSSENTKYKSSRGMH